MGSRERILARRAQFVAAALAATTLGCERKGGPDIVAPAEGDAATPKDARVAPDVGTPQDVEPDGAPTPCLEIAPIDGGIKPRVCLTMFPPHDAGPPPKLDFE